MMDEILHPVVQEHFENDRGHKINETLPGKTDSYEFELGKFSATVFPGERRITNESYDGKSITVRNMTIHPEERFGGLPQDLFEIFTETFGEEEYAQPDTTYDEEDIYRFLQQLQENFEILSAGPTLEDFVEVITDGNFRLAAHLLSEEPQSLLTPSGHELSGLFTNGPVHVIYKDRDIAVLKPEYRHELRREVMNEKLQGFRRVTFTGEVPEPGYVVGIDDTPEGLFGHVVDATRLEYDQDLSREVVHDVMGFDRNLKSEQILDIDVGERVRLQGDLAIEKIDEIEREDGTSRMNLPIDNHLAMLTHARLPPGETKEQVPIRVDIVEPSVLNVVHDEHENLAIDVMPGQYQFYLLSRGLFPERERPDWD